MSGVIRSDADPGLEAAATIAIGLTFPDDASAAAGNLYLSDPVKLEQTLTT